MFQLRFLIISLAFLTLRLCVCARMHACVHAGWRQAATGWSRWMTWWSWDASPTPCASSPTSSPSTITCASSSDPRPSVRTRPLLSSLYLSFILLVQPEAQVRSAAAGKRSTLKGLLLPLVVVSVNSQREWVRTNALGGDFFVVLFRGTVCVWCVSVGLYCDDDV